MAQGVINPLSLFYKVMYSLWYRHDLLSNPPPISHEMNFETFDMLSSNGERLEEI